MNDPLNDAKSWYLKSTSKSHAGLKLNSGSGVKLKSNMEAVTRVDEKLHWNKSKVYKLENGSELVSVPMSIDIQGKAKTNGSFMLLISKSANSYNATVAYNENKDYFLQNFGTLEIQKIYETTLSKTAQKTQGKTGMQGQFKVRPVEDPIVLIGTI